MLTILCLGLILDLPWFPAIVFLLRFESSRAGTERNDVHDWMMRVLGVMYINARLFYS